MRWVDKELGDRMKLTRANIISRLSNVMMRTARSTSNDDKFLAINQQAESLLNEIDSPRVLEIGSRNVTGVTSRHRFPLASEYVGFDVHPGEGVDVVGDVHELSKHVPNNHFDIVFSVSVFEHLLFPWKAAMEINRVLRPGGYILTHTHTVWPEHEMPWDFWRFPHQSFMTFMNFATGFEIVLCGEGRPMRAFPLVDDVPMRKMYKYDLNGAVMCLARKTGPVRDDLVRWDITAEDLVDTVYPPPKDN